jgi:hypothetical protein
LSVHRPQLQKRLTGGDGGPDYAPLLERDDVDVEGAPDAAACGALGCTRAEYLVRVAIETVGKRVVCPRHAANLLKREDAGR